jgi:hypothetical protein
MYAVASQATATWRGASKTLCPRRLFVFGLGGVMMSTESFEPYVRSDGTFRVFVPASGFEKSKPDGSKERRWRGVITTDSKDQEHEDVLQHGLDFAPFLDKGFFNDNHSKSAAGPVGEPDPASFFAFKKGAALPDGTTAKANGHWAEGPAYNDPHSTSIWEKAREAASRGRRQYGFSIEGAILRRTGPNNKTIAKAVVSHVAVTHCPVNTDTKVAMLAKSLGDACRLCEVESDEAERQAREALGAAAAAADQVKMDGIVDMDLAARPSCVHGHAHAAAEMTSTAASKALSMGPPSTSRPSGPVSGAGAGRTLTPQSLEHDRKRDGVRGVEKSLSVGEAIAFVRARFPNISCATAGRIVDYTLAKRRGQGGQHG